jgi:hypothetical protein
MVEARRAALDLESSSDSWSSDEEGNKKEKPRDPCFTIIEAQQKVVKQVDNKEDEEESNAERILRKYEEDRKMRGRTSYMLGQRVEDLNAEAVERVKREKQIVADMPWIKNQEEWNALSEEQK